MSDETYFEQIPVELMKAQIEVQLDEYEQAIEDFRQWVKDYKRRRALDRLDAEL